jgi:hypothetical protein
MRYKPGDKVRIKSLDWYETNKPNMVLHKDTVKTVERLLDLIRDKVYEVDGN